MEQLPLDLRIHKDLAGLWTATINRFDPTALDATAETPGASLRGLVFS